MLRLTAHQKAAATVLAFNNGIGTLDHLMANSGTTRRTWQSLADRGLIMITSDDIVTDIRLEHLIKTGQAA